MVHLLRRLAPLLDFALSTGDLTAATAKQPLSGSIMPTSVCNEVAKQPSDTGSLQQRYSGSFYLANGFKGFQRQLRIYHRLDHEGKKIPTQTGPLNRSVAKITAGSHDFNSQQQAHFISAFLDFVIQQNILFRKACSAQMISLFQMMRTGTEGVFYRSHTQLSKLIQD